MPPFHLEAATHQKEANGKWLSACRFTNRDNRTNLVYFERPKIQRLIQNAKWVIVLTQIWVKVKLKYRQILLIKKKTKK